MTRAKPLPPDQRRATIIAAAKPLLLEYGSSFTTRQVAEAAGIAEGTLFRAFKDKDELVSALIMEVLDPQPACDRIEQIPPALSPQERIEAIMKALQDRNREAVAFFRVLHAASDQRLHSNKPDYHAHIKDRTARLYSAIRAALAPIADRLTCDPDQASWLIHTIALAASRPYFSIEPQLNLTQLATVLTKGLVK